MHRLQQLLETSTHAMNVYAAKMRQNINYIDEENFTGRKSVKVVNYMVVRRSKMVINFHYFPFTSPVYQC